MFKSDIEIAQKIKFSTKGFGMGNNPMVGATVAVAVSVEEAHKAGKF